ncbi:hypothetical protein [Psychrobacter sp.]|uniref:hypothetical protein n=1 Tax=Psychrobacter sp. TaxID=56811 RepID=UPI003F96D972
MTILKNILLSLAVIPVTISTSFAQSGDDMKSQTAMQAQTIQPIAVQENRVVRQRDAKAISSGMNKQLQHDEFLSECYRRHGNPPTVTNIDGSTRRIACEAREEREDVDGVVQPPISPGSYQSDTDYARE